MRTTHTPRRGTWTGAVGRGLSAFRDFLVHHLGAHVSPNSLTLVGVFFSVATGFVLANGHFRWGVLLILAASLFDVLDGAVARMHNLGTRFGAFYDSSLDRLSDCFIFGGLIWHYADVRDTTQLAVALVALGGAMMVSYTRARAECIIPSCKVGFGERPERIGILVVGSFLGAPGMEIALWIIAILANVTWVHRSWYTWLQLEGGAAPRRSMSAWPRRLLSVVFWEHRRASVAYDIKVAALLLIVVVYSGYQYVRQTGPVVDEFQFTLLAAPIEVEDLGHGLFYVDLRAYPLEKDNTALKNEFIRLLHDENPAIDFRNWEEEAGPHVKGFYYTTGNYGARAS